MKKLFKNAKIENIYNIDGYVPLGKAIPFGLQHILAMFVANLTPILIIAATLTQETRAILLQNAMFVAGIATIIQLFPIWRVGSKLPIVMGVSFTFVGVLSSIAVNYGYPYVVGAVLVGGIFEGTIGLFAAYWRKLISPIVAAVVVTTIGYSLLSVGASSFGGGSGSIDYGSWQNLLIGSITLVSCILWNCLIKGHLKQLSVLFGLVIGYITSIFFGKVDLSQIFSNGFISFPKILPVMPKFNFSAILSVCIIYLVSAVETIGDATSLSSSVFYRDISDLELSGAIACDGYASTFSGLFGCPPITSFSQNIGLVSMTKVVNRFTIGVGAIFMILAGLLPPVGNFFASIPDAVLGGCTLMMFGMIMISGIEMLAKCGFNQRNVTIMSLSLAIGIGFTADINLWSAFPSFFKTVFAENVVAVVFVVSIILNLVLPKNMDIKKITDNVDAKDIDEEINNEVKEDTKDIK